MLQKTMDKVFSWEGLSVLHIFGIQDRKTTFVFLMGVDLKFPFTVHFQK